MTILEILILAVIQGAAELLPISSSAHVILAERWMKIDPSTPEATFLLVMLHTGTMFAVIVYFWPRWRAALGAPGESSLSYAKWILLATVATGAVGMGLKVLIERVFLPGGESAEIEQLFRNLPLMAGALFAAGVIIIVAGTRETGESDRPLSPSRSLWIGTIQGLCLPFRGFSRSGATISTGLLVGLPRMRAEDFSFALAVVLTPPVIARELHRLLRSAGPAAHGAIPGAIVLPGLGGMVLAFLSGLVALRVLSKALEKGRFQYFGYYCIAFSALVLASDRLLEPLR